MKLIFLSLFLLTSFFSLAQPNCSAVSTGFAPINDLGTGISPVTGLMGGLYPNGSNFLPAAHKAAGLQMASQIECLDASGNPDPVNGKIVWLSIGMSNCTQETQQFIPLANAFAGKNPKLILVDGAQGGQTAQVISTISNSGYAAFWSTVNTRLSTAGVTTNQVQAIWFKEANQAGTTPIQTYHDSLVVQIKRCMNEIKTRFPNVKVCYLASRISGRYATTTLNPEPYSYWTGWAVKKVIADQINGDVQLAYSGTGAKSPWLSWGIYMWSDGSTPQTTNPNVFFTCPGDYQNDGTHPSTAGAQKVGGLLLNFFSSDSTCIPWFLGTGCPAGVGIEEEESENAMIIYPNPCNGKFLVIGSAWQRSHVVVYNLFGEKIYSMSSSGGGAGGGFLVDLSGVQNGIYFLKITNGNNSYRKKIVITN